ncbi:DUF3606 domain-containing protein [Caenimonas sp. S4]|nr:DUF3606 domain-containing protein [Caenimonas soli]
MVDPSTPYKPLDPGRIDTQNRVELQYWSRELHCTVAELTDAVKKVGDHVTSVREHLAAHH